MLFRAEAGSCWDQDVGVLWGRCVEEGGAPPYWPWVQVLRSHLRGRGRDELRAELGSGAPDIASIVPDVDLPLPDLATPAILDDSQQARFRLFDAITGFWKNVSPPGTSI
jgi:hypothetical protein